MTVDIEHPGELLAYLRRAGRIDSGETPEIRILAGGVSNRTVRVRRASGEAWVLKQALEKLRVAMDWRSSPERVHREAEALRWLAKLAPAGAVVPLVFEDLSNHILAMQAVPEPHDNWKSLLLAGRLAPRHVAEFGRLLGTVHRRGCQAGPELAAALADRSFFDSLRLAPYYQTAAERNPAAASFFAQLIEETRGRRVTFVHGDYSPKNILIRLDRLILLDHEVAHFGDPAFDLGFALTHLLSKAHHVPGCREALLDAARLFWTAYAGEAGEPASKDDLPARAVRHCLGCLLARVDGRSPLEYLTAGERDRQRQAALSLMDCPARSPLELIERFAESTALRP